MNQFIFGLVFISISGLAIFGQQRDFDTSFEGGISMANRGNFVEALAQFQNAESSIETSRLSKKRLAQLHFNIGVCHFRLEKNADALSRFETAVQLFPKYERAHYALGMAASRKFDWQKSERAFLNALKLNRSNAETWFDLAFVYLATGEMLRAKAAFETSLELNTVDAATAYNNIGVISASFGDRKNAERAFENSVRVSNGTYEIAAANLTVIRLRHEETLVAANLKFGMQRNFFGE